MRYREDTGYPVLGATPPVRSRAYALVKIVPPAQFCPRDSLTHNGAPITPRVMGRGGIATRGRGAAEQAAPAEYGA